jgi:hypothetical protein
MTTSFRTETNGLSGAVAFDNIDNIKLVNTGPELLGVPKAPTAAVGTNTTQVATTAFVTAAITAGTTILPSNATPAVGTVSGTPGASTTYSRGDHAHPSMLSNALPAADSASGTAGTSTNVSRGDHSHPLGAQSLTSNGYITLPGGLMMQWGFNTFSSTGSTVLFPISFPSAVYAVTATAASASGTENCTVYSQTTASFSGKTANSIGCFWIAIGR